ncbi:MAG: ArsA family ATPase [Bdellovibrionaceae bacterium]|nr:ArsA family ATPase [Bdellovibrio sp.]
MINLGDNTKTLICIGTGGVGKTTIAASMGVGFAYQGQKVLVLTIDPSKRLAQALGVKPDGDPHQVRLSENTSGGELWSCVVNHQKTFEFFIREAAHTGSGKSISPENLNKLLQNKLYQQLSGRLSGSQDFTSLITLNRYVTSGEFDLVILDTPPSQHTWNFLRAPEKIAGLFNEGIARWFRDADSKDANIFKKMINLGTSQVLKALESLTGSQFIKELSTFFQAIQKWQKPLEDYIMNCHRLLISPHTEFILVTALDPSRLGEAQKLSREIKMQGYRLTTVIINRVPLWLTIKTASPSARVANLISYYESLENDLQGRLALFKTQLKVYKCYELRQNTEDVSSLQKNFDELVPLN